MATVLLEAPFRLPPRPARTDLTARYFRALSEPTRLRILQLLRDEGELTVGALADRLRVSQPTVSNHLACLRWCGFLGTRRQHRTVFNFLADARVLEMLALAEGLLDDNAEHVACCSQLGA